MAQNEMAHDKMWEKIESECNGCTKCALYKTKINTVFGTGNKEATLMFVGEAPGASEDAAGIPFVGKAGKLFDKYLSAVGISRDEVYIANILKCRPPQNRDPQENEENACMDYLREQIRLVSPKIIVCLGRISAMRLIKTDFRITAEHGKWFKKGNFKICAVYHPSALLRDVTKREDMLKDFIEIKRAYDAEI